MLLPAMPLTKNGKIDRDALPHPEEAERRSEKVAPRTDAESQLSAIWSELLGIEDLGVHDNFFDLGGHSLSAMQLLSQDSAELRCGAAAPQHLRSADRSRRLPRGLPQPRAPPRERRARRSCRGTRGGVIPASFSQERLWLFDQLQPGSSAYNVPAAVRVTGPLDVPALEQTIHGVVDRHEVLRTTFEAVDGRPVQVIARRGSMRMAFVDLRDLRGKQQDGQLAALARADALRPFNLSDGPVWRATVVQLGIRGTRHLLESAPHLERRLVRRLFARELSELYSSFAGGRLRPGAVDDPVRRLQPVAEALVGRGRKGGHAAYWKAASGGCARLAGAADRPASAARAELPRRSGVGGPGPRTLEGADGVGQAGGGDDVHDPPERAECVAVPAHRSDGHRRGIAHGGSKPERDRGLDWFLPEHARAAHGGEGRRELPGPPPAGPGGGAWRVCPPGASIRANVEELQVERDMSRPVLYQVMFNHQKASETRLAFGDLRLTPMGGADATSKFDLTLYALEGAEQMSLRMAYNSDLFDRATVAALLARFVVLLQAIVAEPDCKVASLPLLKEEERVSRHAPGLPSRRLRHSSSSRGPTLNRRSTSGSRSRSRPTRPHRREDQAARVDLQAAR